MDSITYLQHQFSNLLAYYRFVVADISQEEMTFRPAPGENMVGYTVWHIPRTQDAHFQTWIRGVPEVAHNDRWSDWFSLRPLGYGVGISLEDADQIARSVNIPDVLAYADVVYEEIGSWLQGINEEDLDFVPDYFTHLSRYPEYQTAGFLNDLGDLTQQPIWNQVLRTCVGHIYRHLGELEIVKTIIRAGEVK